MTVRCELRFLPTSVPILSLIRASSHYYNKNYNNYQFNRYIFNVPYYLVSTQVCQESHRCYEHKNGTTNTQRDKITSAHYTDNFLMVHVSSFKDMICRNELNGKELTTDLEKFTLWRVTVRISFELPSYFEDFSFCYSNSIIQYSVHSKFPHCPSFQGF